MTKLKKYFQPFFFHLRLLFLSPKDYLYSYKTSAKKKVKIFPYSQKTGHIAQYFSSLLKNMLPGITMHFVGSASYRIAGEKEIDFFLESSPQNFSKHLPKLEKKFGKPTIHKKNFIQWFVPHRGYMIDIALVDPESKQFQQEMKAINLLKRNEKLKKQYEQLKLNSVGKSNRHYQWKKIEFFHRIMNKYSLESL